MKSLVFANEVYSNISKFRVTQKQIEQDTIVDEVFRQTRKWFRILNEAQDSGTLRNLVWQLRTSLQLSLLPFDDSELNIRGLLNEISNESRYYPELKESLEALEYSVSCLLENPSNPKATIVFQELNQSGYEGTGIVISLTRWKTPGWSKNAQKLIRAKVHRVSFVQSKTQLKNQIFKRLLLPGNARFSPLLRDLMTGGHCEELIAVYYREEGFYIPKPVVLPKATVHIIHAEPSLKVVREEVENIDSEVNRWFEKNFWSDVRTRAMGDGNFDHEGEHAPFLVNSRLVLLGNGSKVFLGEDHKVLEISDLVEGKADIDSVGRVLPHKKTGDLTPGDLIVLRTEGGGDHVVDIADSMMTRDGHAEYLKKMKEWKTLLKAALQHFGPQLIFSGLAKRGCSFKNSDYIWMWTTDQIIAPQNKSTFLALLDTLFELDSALPGTSEKLCDQYWEQVLTIRKYRRNAGQYLRRKLLEKLRELIRDGVKIDDVYNLHLGEDSKGSLSVFRVSAVDELTTQISYCKTGVVIKGEMHSNG